MPCKNEPMKLFHMWPDLVKDVLSAHGFDIHFSHHSMDTATDSYQKHMIHSQYILVISAMPQKSFYA